jgi:hypothetical protein
MTKISELRIQTTVRVETRILAAIISMLTPLGCQTTERILKTVCNHFGLEAKRV